MCSAAQGRRAALLGEAADSLPIGVRMRRPVALGGGGNPFTANQRLAVTPQRGAPSSRREPPRVARRRALSQAAATATSDAPPPPRSLHRRRFSARMVPTLAISSSPCARPSQRARPKNRRGAAAAADGPPPRAMQRVTCVVFEYVIVTCAMQTRRVAIRLHSAQVGTGVIACEFWM